MDENTGKKLLHAVGNGKERESCLLSENSWEVLYQLSDIRENILEWYDFRPGASLLEIGAECGALTGLFCRKVHHVTAVEESEDKAAVNRARNAGYGNLTVEVGNFRRMEIKEKFDYVTLIGTWEPSDDETEQPYLDTLKRVRECLKPEGKLFLATENRYGLKYFAGAPEEHTGRCFDGLENYVGAGNIRTFSHKTLQKMLWEAGFSDSRFYYPIPDYKLPSEIYSDENLPSFGSIRYATVSYDRNRYELLDERLAFDSICQDGMFGEFANSFLIVSSCGQQNTKTQVQGGGNGQTEQSDITKNVLYAKYNRLRAPEFQISTKIIAGEEGNRWVEKAALRPEARRHIEGLLENRRKLASIASRGAGTEEAADIPVPVEMIRNDDGLAVFPFVEGVSLAKEVTKFLGKREGFLQALHRAVESIYGAFLRTPEMLVNFRMTKEFEHIFGVVGDEQTAEILKGMKSLAVSNIDSILSNFVRLSDGKLVCLDYEWVFTFPIPVEYLIYRTVYYYYSENIHYIKIGEAELWEEFGLNEAKVGLFRRMDDCFQQYVHGEKRKYIYTANYGKKTINIGKDIQNGENWFLSIADDIHYLNSHLGGYRRDLIKCHIKVDRRDMFLAKCREKMPKGLKKLIHKLKK